MSDFSGLIGKNLWVASINKTTLNAGKPYLRGTVGGAYVEKVPDPDFEGDRGVWLVTIDCDGAVEEFSLSGLLYTHEVWLLDTTEAPVVKQGT